MAVTTIKMGTESFRELRENKQYYVDKTGFLLEFLTAIPAKVSLFTRPRRFGKTLTFSMFKEFLDITAESRDLFDGLVVADNHELCNAWMNQYPVIAFSLKEVQGPTFAHVLNKIRRLLSKICVKNDGILQSPTIHEKTKQEFRDLLMEECGQAALEDALRLLCEVLHAYYKKRPIILIDEYDVPLNHAQQNGYYKQMVEFMRTFLGAALKTNDDLNFAVLTGCLRISKESIFTGLNNFKCFGVSDEKFSQFFGFTENEVSELLHVAGMSESMPLVKEWYDGYRFGRGHELYCPWDVLQYVQDRQDNDQIKPQSYWKNSSGNAIVNTLIEMADTETRQNIETLLAGESIAIKLDEQLTYDTVFSDVDHIWSVLYVTGYLTRAPEQSDDTLTSLVIPNKEVKSIFTDLILARMKTVCTSEVSAALAQAFWVKDAESAEKSIRSFMLQTISYHDDKESFYHGMMTGLLSNKAYVLKSNIESGQGRPDLILEDRAARRVIILEFKHADRFTELQAKADEALAQIEMRRYAEGVAANITEIIKVGIAFWDKECVVKIL